MLPGLPSLFRPFMESMLRQNPERIETDGPEALNDGGTSNSPSSAISASHLENRKENVSALAKIQGLFSTAECENGTGTNAEKWLRFFGTLQGTKVSIDKKK